MTDNSSRQPPQADSLANMADMGLPARAVRIMGGLWLAVSLLLGGAVLAGRAAPAHASGLIIYVSNQDVQRVSSSYRGGSWAVGNIELFLLHLEQGLSRNLTRSAGTDHRPTLSPDGGMIVFESERDGNPEIYLMSVNGGPAINLTRHEAADTTPTWSPDGNFIAFLSWRDGGGSLYLMNPLGQNVRRLTDIPGSDIWSPVWSPDGRQIAFITWHIAQLDIAVLTLPDDLATSVVSIRYLCDGRRREPAAPPDDLRARRLGGAVGAVIRDQGAGVGERGSGRGWRGFRRAVHAVGQHHKGMKITNRHHATRINTDDTDLESVFHP